MNSQDIVGPLQEKGFCLLKAEACTDRLLGLDLPRGQGIFELVWIKQGAGTCSLDDETIVFGHSTLCMLLGRRLQLLHTVFPIQGYYIAFLPSFLYPEKLEFQFFDPAGMFWQGNRTVVEVGLGLQSELEGSVNLLETSAGGAVTGAMVRNQLQALLYGIIRQIGKKASPQLSGYVLVERFQSLVKRDLCLKKTASAYARELGVSPNHMNQVVKRITGLPASYHIIQHKIAEAKKQIALHHWDMKTTAIYLGFKNVSHFCRFFKTNTQMDFSNFRKNQ
jgi:AraC family transcriptional regulator, transcriptional activator of pobA